MNIPVMKLGDKESTDFVFLKDKGGTIKAIIEYDLNEILILLNKELAS